VLPAPLCFPPQAITAPHCPRVDALAAWLTRLPPVPLPLLAACCLLPLATLARSPTFQGRNFRAARASGTSGPTSTSSPHSASAFAPASALVSGPSAAVATGSAAAAPLARQLLPRTFIHEPDASGLSAAGRRRQSVAGRVGESQLSAAGQKAALSGGQQAARRPDGAQQTAASEQPASSQPAAGHAQPGQLVRAAVRAAAGRLLRPLGQSAPEDCVRLVPGARCCS